ncbi:NRDE2 isoform 4 [Pan troglodytes]|uniref:NRDE2 isoform 4 n=1 Tax=Pan troglodytes TaxID=9598 RepID=A0A2J8PKW8_PANTR|nr:NRDE2 isoform 4 [Pan troglodytes]
MKVTLTKSSNKQVEKRRKRKRKKGSISIIRKQRGSMGRRVAAGLRQTPILKRTNLPEASEAVKRNLRNRIKEIMLQLILDIALFGLRTFRL